MGRNPGNADGDLQHDQRPQGLQISPQTTRSVIFRADYRRLHDSFFNGPGGKVQIITCLHEVHTMAMAYGQTKVSDTLALVIAHSNVGAVHASMAVYKAQADRAPSVVLSATGAMDAMQRRPWIEWIHTVQDYGQILRPFNKCDD